MNPVSWAGLATFAVAAAADWAAVGREQRAAEYVLKPLALAALVVVAGSVDPGDGAMRAWFVAALTFSLAGDVFLMLPRDRFVAGLGSFLVAHVAYVVGLQAMSPSPGALAASAAAVALVAAPLGRRIVGGARAGGHDALVVPVVAYMVVISAMVASALAVTRPWAVAGAFLFYVSDALIGWSRFVAPFRGHRLAIMVTYHLGQAGLVLSLL